MNNSHSTLLDRVLDAAPAFLSARNRYPLAGSSWKPCQVTCTILTLRTSILRRVQDCDYGRLRVAHQV